MNKTQYIPIWLIFIQTKIFMSYKKLFIFHFFCLIIYSCSVAPEKKFQIIDPDDSGIHFSNTIISNDTFNVVDFYYIYNGGGVGIGDFNNDGLQDVFFSSNEVANELYLNEGNFKFMDITETAGVKAEDIWSQGNINCRHKSWRLAGYLRVRLHSQFSSKT